MLDRARLLRREMTLPERLLWREVRGRRLGPRFRRQVPMEPYLPREGGGAKKKGRSSRNATALPPGGGNDFPSESVPYCLP